MLRIDRKVQTTFNIIGAFELEYMIELTNKSR